MGTGDQLFTIKKVKDFLELLIKAEEIIKEVAPLDRQLSTMKKYHSRLEETISSLKVDIEELKNKHKSVGSEIPRKQEAAALKHKTFIEGLRKEEREAKEKTARILSTLGKEITDAEERTKLRRGQLNKEIERLESKLNKTRRAIESAQSSLGDIHIGGA